ncbi:MAG: imidazoleglycerol-phosphate dehydratase HisB [Vicinamibacteria bacterium]
MRVRKGQRKRTTRETAVEASLVLDGSGVFSIETGMPFLDHMLEIWTHHGFFDLDLKAKGDLEVDYHHSVEDVGLVLGECLAEALEDKSGIQRFGSAYVPLDEALSRVVVDISGRPYLSYEVRFATERVGSFPTELFEDFFRGFADRARVTLHLDWIHGRNSHHVAETLFKAFARALKEAVRVTSPGLLPSTKGTLTV